MEATEHQKKGRSQNMPKPIAETARMSKYHPSDIVAKSEEKVEQPGIYANHVQFIMTSHETVMDFYLISPENIKPTDLKAIHLARILLPNTVLKGFATALVNSVLQFEQDNNVKLPSLRDKQENDKVEVFHD